MNKVILSAAFLIFCLCTELFCYGENDRSATAIEYYQPYEVGEIGEAWQFPSDHLPIGATIGNFHIAFWNILNKNYLGHIEENTQGLKNSSILRDNVPFDRSLLTVREKIVIDQIFQMINHSTHPRSLVALQETHKDVQNYLKTHLPDSWKILTPPNQPISQDIFLYDSEIFEFISLGAVKYSSQFPKTIFTLNLREKASNNIYRFIQSHVPGGPINSAEGCEKFSTEALKQYDPNVTIVLMGDMNQSPSIIAESLLKTAEKLGVSQPYQHLSVAYPTHMNTHLQASWIDNFFIYAPECSANIKASDSPEEMFDALVPIVELLKTFQVQVLK